MNAEPRVIGRLAPSPTGALHLGNARSFLLAWLSVRQQGGTLLLRIEDIDSPRVKPWALQATIEDLRWLGLDWDAGPDDDVGTANGNAVECKSEFGNQISEHAQRASAGDSRFSMSPIPLVQSARLPRYREVLEQLIADEVIYPCVCTRSEIAAAASAPHESNLLDGVVYPGTCRSRNFNPNDLSQDKFAWRWAFDSAEISWTDGLRGPLGLSPADKLGDFIVARGDGTPAYQLAVVVDDYDSGVTEVVRGDDLVFSTFRQLAILEHLGWRPPSYFHVPLIVGPDGRRLAKRHGDTRLSYFRERGIDPQTIIGYLAWTLNLSPSPSPIEPQALLGRLDWAKLPRSPTVFTLDGRLGT